MIKAISALLLLLCFACSPNPRTESTDYNVQTETIAISQVGAIFQATFNNEEVIAEGIRTSPLQLELKVVTQGVVITSYMDLAEMSADVSAVGIHGQDIQITETLSKSLKHFSLELFENLPGDRETAELGNRIARLATMYSKHPVDVVPADRTIRPDKERGLTNLCWYYHGERPWTGYFDYEFIRCEWYGCFPVWRDGSWTGNVGGVSCYARCGIGCGGESVYSVDCANHDACKNAGKNDYQCQDEFDDTWDDYTFGQDCD